MARLSKDQMDKFFDYSIDIDSRTIYLGSATIDPEYGESGVDAAMAERLIKAVHLLDLAAPGKDKPITILTNNPGGDWYHGMASFDCIKNCNNHVTMIAYGHAMSMGSILLQAADHRVISKNAKFMIHYGYSSADNHSLVVLKWAKEGQRINRDMEDIYLERILEKDSEVITEGDDTYMEKVLERILNKQVEGDLFPKPTRKIKLPTDPIKRKEAIRTYLQELLTIDTILTAAETVAIGLADAILGE